MSAWIRAADSLPRDGSSLFVIADCGERAHGYYTAYYDGGFFVTDPSRRAREVTHWMYAPAMPVPPTGAPLTIEALKRKIADCGDDEGYIPCWIEGNFRDGDGTPIHTLDAALVSDGDHMVSGIASIWENDYTTYGERWRVWLERPTDEERDAALWSFPIAAKKHTLI